MPTCQAKTNFPHRATAANIAGNNEFVLTFQYNQAGVTQPCCGFPALHLHCMLSTFCFYFFHFVLAMSSIREVWPMISSYGYFYYLLYFIYFLYERYQL